MAPPLPDPPPCGPAAHVPERRAILCPPEIRDTHDRVIRLEVEVSHLRTETRRDIQLMRDTTRESLATLQKMLWVIFGGISSVGVGVLIVLLTKGRV